jgi:hypothetical protein
VIYDDTAAFGRTIRSLDNPFGRKSTENLKVIMDLQHGFSVTHVIRVQNISFMYATMD